MAVKASASSFTLDFDREVETRSTEIGFEENKGQIKQTDGSDADYVAYMLRNENARIYLLSEGGIAFQFVNLDDSGYLDRLQSSKSASTAFGNGAERARAEEEISLETYRMDMKLFGANTSCEIIAEEKLPDYVSYRKYDVNAAYRYRKVTYRNIYPNIDWVVYTVDDRFKYDFVVHPGGDPDQIKLLFSDHEQLSVDDAGNLIHSNRLGTFTENKPVSFQEGTTVETRFVCSGDTVKFHMAGYDSEKVLTIDPEREWATYYGGADDDRGFGTAVDASGNVYLTGITVSTDNIAESGHQMQLGGAPFDAFLVKFNSAGQRQWATYFGGDLVDEGNDCVTDASGNIYVAGMSRSEIGIALNGHQNANGGLEDAFLAKFNPEGGLIWSTYYGGTAWDSGNACAVDNQGFVYLAGNAMSEQNIFFNGHQSTNTGTDAFVAKFTSGGERIWGTYYGGNGSDVAHGCATDLQGNVYVAGQTAATAGIASGGHQNNVGGLFDAFLVKFDGFGQRLWSTYYGGSGRDYGNGCAVDQENNVYICGTTDSPNNIAFNGHQNTQSGSTDIYDAFLAKFDSNGNRMWGTYFGGSSTDQGSNCTTDAEGNAYLVGAAFSQDMPTTAYQTTHAGSQDAFIAKFTPNGTQDWSSFYGGDSGESAWSVSAASDGSIYMAGFTMSNGQIASGGHQNDRGGFRDAFLVKFSDDSSLSQENSENSDVGLQVWPNPTSSIARIEMPEEVIAGAAMISNSVGQVVQKFSWSGNFAEIDLSSQPNGLYICNIYAEGGLMTTKIIKQ